MLVLSFAIGGLAGLADFQRQDHPSRYKATAEVVMDDAKRHALRLSLGPETGGERTAEDAVALAGSMISQIDSYSQTLITIRELWWSGTWMIAVGGKLP